MDARRFDQLVRHWTEAQPRRPLLGLAVGGATGLLWLRNVPAKHKKRKSKKVTLCLNGQTITVPRKKQGSFVRQGATVGPCPGGGGDGPCRADGDCDRCARETCQAGVCGCPDDMVRDTNGICHTPRLNCYAVGQTVSSPTLCCSGTGSQIQFGFFCIPGTTTCAQNQDCAGGGKCLGGMCPPLYLGVAGQACKAGIGCTSPNDCGDSACRDGVCVNSESTGQCGTDQFGQCTCENGVCASSHAAAGFFTGTCDHTCPAGTVRCAPLGPGVGCHPACGKSFACCSKPGDFCGGSVCQ